MILTGLTPKSLTAAGRLVVFALATLLLPFAPISGGAPDDEKKPVTAAARIVEVPVDLDLAVDLVVDDDDDDDKDKGKDKDKAAKEKRPVVQRRVEVRRIETGKGDDKGKEKATKAPVKTEDAAALEKARVELKEAQEALEKAARRVAELQMKINGVGGQGRFEFKTEGDVIVMRKDGDKDVVIREFKLDGPEGVGKRARLFAAPLAGEGMKFNMPVPPGGPFGDQERRLKDLEKKLDKIIGELDSLKKKDAKSGR